MDLPEVLTLRVVNPDPAAIHKLRFWISLPLTLVPTAVSTWDSALSFSICFINLGGSGLPCVLTTPEGPRRVYFKYCSATSRMDWGLPTSLHVELGARCVFFTVKNIFYEV